MIVHKRGYDNEYGADNLFCVEMKKDMDHHGYEGDLVRLNKLVSRDYGFNYK